MTAVYKYPMAVMCGQVVTMPVGAEILCVQVQDNTPCLWAKVNTDNALEDRKIRMYGTGDPVDDASGRYIGTFQIQSLVFHVFEV